MREQIWSGFDRLSTSYCFRSTFYSEQPSRTKYLPPITKAMIEIGPAAIAPL